MANVRAIMLLTVSSWQRLQALLRIRYRQGPLVHPSLDVTIITPICAHALYTRPLLIPMDRVIELNAIPPYEELLLSADGEIVASIAENDTVRIAKSPDKVTFIRLNGRSYYETWQEKLIRNTEML